MLLPKEQGHVKYRWLRPQNSLNSSLVQFLPLFMNVVVEFFVCRNFVSDMDVNSVTLSENILRQMFTGSYWDRTMLLGKATWYFSCVPDERQDGWKAQDWDSEDLIHLLSVPHTIYVTLGKSFGVRFFWKSSGPDFLQLGLYFQKSSYSGT